MQAYLSRSIRQYRKTLKLCTDHMTKEERLRTNLARVSSLMGLPVPYPKGSKTLNGGCRTHFRLFLPVKIFAMISEILTNKQKVRLFGKNGLKNCLKNWRREGDLNPRGPKRPQAAWCLPIANISRLAPCLARRPRHK